MTVEEWKALYPQGRLVFYEGDNPTEFIAAMTAAGLKPTISVHVPPEKLDTVIKSWEVGT